MFDVTLNAFPKYNPTLYMFNILIELEYFKLDFIRINRIIN